MIVSTSVVLLALLLGTLSAYALGRLNFRGRKLVLYLILSMTMFPAIAILGSLFQMMNDFRAFDTLWGLVIVYLTFTLPFTVWVLTNFFRAMPAELEQSALVDGATPMRALWDILLPMAVPELCRYRNPGRASTGCISTHDPDPAAGWNAGTGLRRLGHVVQDCHGNGQADGR